jgi:hypothetical protein
MKPGDLVMLDFVDFDGNRFDHTSNGMIALIIDDASRGNKREPRVTILLNGITLPFPKRCLKVIDETR